MQQLVVKEQLIKTVVKSGNGGAVWVPKAWLGEEVVVILPNKPQLNVKERILHVLEPYLKDVLSVSVYGSYARKEATQNSDIDVLVITKDKQFTIITPDKTMEFLVLPFNKMKEVIEKFPTQYYQIIQEAEPLINASLIEDLKGVQIQKKIFKEYLKETKEHIQSNKTLIELDKLDGIYLTSFSVLYSLLLRFRAIFIIRCIVDHESFSNKKFKKWVVGKGISAKNFEDCYAVYRKVRDGNSIKDIKVKATLAEKIVRILEQEIQLVEREL